MFLGMDLEFNLLMASNAFSMMKNFMKAILFSLLFSYANAQTNDMGNLVVIGNKIEFKTMKKNSVINVFKGRLNSWNNGTVVIIVLPSQKNENSTEVAKIIYGTTVKGMQKFWLSLVFQGRSNPPVFLDTDEDIIKYVQKNPGSIGLIHGNSEFPKNIQIEIIK
jgi:hypothetical protein